MIVVDTSALIAIALDEPQAMRLMQVLHEADTAVVSAASVTETLIVAMGRDCEAQIGAVFDHFGLIVEPVTGFRAKSAAAAYRRYGKGWHTASLNLGDSFAYALAAELRCPLLYIGHDFAKTDVVSALS